MRLVKTPYSLNESLTAWHRQHWAELSRRIVVAESLALNLYSAYLKPDLYNTVLSIYLSIYIYVYICIYIYIYIKAHTHTHTDIYLKMSTLYRRGGATPLYAPESRHFGPPYQNRAGF